VGVEEDGKDQLEGHETNEEVLQEVQEEKRFMDVIWRRKKIWIGHIGLLKDESLLREVIRGSDDRKNTKGKEMIRYAK